MCICELSVRNIRGPCLNFNYLQPHDLLTDSTVDILFMDTRLVLNEVPHFIYMARAVFTAPAVKTALHCSSNLRLADFKSACVLTSVIFTTTHASSVEYLSVLFSLYPAHSHIPLLLSSGG